MHARVERALEALGYLLCRRAWPVIACALLVVGAGATRIPDIEIKASTDDFLRRDDPTKQAYDAFLERFGRDDAMFVAIEPPEVFELGFLEKLRRLHREIEDGVPHVREVLSLVNARETRGVGDELIVGEFLEEWPADVGALAAIRDRALANPLYRGFYVSRDAGLAAVVIELESFAHAYEADGGLSGFDDAEPEAPSSGGERERLTGAQEREAVEALNAILVRYEAPDFRIYAGGAPIINVELMGSLLRDIALFTALSVCVIALFLALVLRRVVGVLVPLGVSSLSLVATLAVMGTFGIPAMPVSEIIPSFLLSVGVGGTVHLIVIFQQRLADGARREDAIAGALRHSGLPIVMTSLTTAGGLASFAAAQLVPVAIFGTVAPLGIVLTLVFTLVLAPALLAVVPLGAAGDRRQTPSKFALTRVGELALAQAPRVLVGAGVLLVAALLGMAQLRVSFNTLDWFPDDMPAKVASAKLDEELGGAMTLEIVLEADAEDGLRDPELLSRIARAQHTLEGLQVRDVVAGNTLSYVDIVKEIHKALHAGAHDTALPSERSLLAQELLLFENAGSDDLEDVVDPQFKTARMTVRVPFVDGSQYPAFGAEAARIVEKQLEGRARASLTGLMVVSGRSFAAAIETVIRAYGIALVVITPLMMLLLGSFRLGLVAMVPNLFPIALTIGLMGWLDIPLEMFSLLIGSVALGLAVDDTIHFMHGFRRVYAREGDVALAVGETLRTTGQALLFTSVVLSIGFFIYTASALQNLRSFGMLTAFAIATAFLADVLLAPALMKYCARFSSVGAAPPPASTAPGAAAHSR